MFLFPIAAVAYASVDPGETVTNPELEVSTKGTLGRATIRCTIHASIDQASLFAEQASSVAEQTLTVS